MDLQIDDGRLENVVHSTTTKKTPFIGTHLFLPVVHLNGNLIVKSFDMSRLSLLRLSDISLDVTQPCNMLLTNLRSACLHQLNLEFIRKAKIHELAKLQPLLLYQFRLGTRTIYGYIQNISQSSLSINIRIIRCFR